MILSATMFADGLKIGVTTTVPFGMIGLSLSTTDKTVGMYVDYMYSNDIQSGHVGVQYNLSKVVNPYIGVGIYTDTDSKGMGGSIATGFLINIKNSNVGIQQGAIIDIHNGVDIKLNLGITLKIK
jgi:hypothetical protein